MGSFTYNGGINDKREIIPASRFCGVFDGQDLIFPGITSKDKFFCQLILRKSRLINIVHNEITLCISFIPGTSPGPIVIHVRTDEQLKWGGLQPIPTSSLQALDIANSGIENGFKLSYQLTNNCPDFV